MLDRVANPVRIKERGPGEEGGGIIQGGMLKEGTVSNATSCKERWKLEHVMGSVEISVHCTREAKR